MLQYCWIVWFISRSFQSLDYVKSSLL